ncbi:bZIP transcription factor 29-like [Diospyros lotus]|uniref:bZIP transcription factor 29-like n=1 Tax=Diospyros lotus TaxID=55363 RepID=UPI00225BABA9|nr:bZIP transcription factor 29-like [Diospyros lotus]
MEDTDETGVSPCLFLEHQKRTSISNLNLGQFGPSQQKSQCANPHNSTSIPSSSYLQIAKSQPDSPQQPINENCKLGTPNSISSSEPSFLSMSCLPPLSRFPHYEPLSSPNAIPADVSTRKGHRRSSSDVPLAFSAMIQSSPQLIPISGKRALGGSERDNLVGDKQIWSVKQELDFDEDRRDNGQGTGERKSEGKVVNGSFVTFMNLDNFDLSHPSATEDKDMDGRTSGTKPHGGESSDNEVESNMKRNPGTGVSFSTEKREVIKSIAGEEISPTVRHFRSFSMGGFVGNFNLDDEATRLPPLLGTQAAQHSPSNSIDGNLRKFGLEFRNGEFTSAAQHSPSNSIDGNLRKFGLEFRNGEFTSAELQKIMANEKLAEIALSDPKRAKRILANRQSAARSKERKMHYISELEHKVQTLQTEATSLSTQLALLQRESTALSSQNNELKFRIETMEQQAQLKDALSEALTAEVHRLKLATAGHRGAS